MFKHYWLPGLMVLAVQGAWAQTPPSAGGQLQQIPAVPAAPGLLTPVQVPPQAAVPSAAVSGRLFRVQALHLTGVSVYNDDDLLKVAGFEANRDQSLASLQAMAERISDHYRRDGYLLARAYLPAQAVRNGVITMAVLEGRYGPTTVNNTSRLNPSVARGLLDGLDQGDVIATAALEERLLLLSDVPGVQVRSTLVPGASLGVSDLVVDVQPAALLSGSVDADNAGNRYTGVHRLGATLNLNNPTGMGDVLSFRGLTSGSGLRYARASYQAPVGRARVGVAYSELAYELGREFEALDAHGRARVTSLFGSYPLLRSRQSNLTAGLTLEHKDFDDRQDAVSLQVRKRSEVAVASLSGERRDAWGGGGLSSFSAAWSSGNLDIRTPEAHIADAATARSDGHFNKWALAISRVQRVSNSVSVSAMLSGQMAANNLDVSEKMSLGGMNGVRAYPEGEANADEGYLLALETRYQLRPIEGVRGHVQLAAFIDAGEVKTHHSPWASGENRRHLSSAGVGVYWTQSRDFSVKALYAHQLGNEEATSAPHHSGRFWVQGVKYF
jgi:hemolysin activation/secretion protein